MIPRKDLHSLEVLIPFVFLFAVLSQIDIVFDDDQGFYRTLKQLIRSAKCPVVLTCNGSSSLCFWTWIHVRPAHSSIRLFLSYFLNMRRISSRIGRGGAHAEL